MTSLNKRCPKCKRLLPIGSFYQSPSRGHYLQPYCKECTAVNTREWRQGNKDKVRMHYQNAKPQRRRNRHKLSGEAEARLYEVAGSRCWICGIEEGSRLLCFDHDHSSGLVRGLLCISCNLLLGYSQDTPARLRKAANYLEGKLAANKKWLVNTSNKGRDGSGRSK